MAKPAPARDGGLVRDAKVEHVLDQLPRFLPDERRPSAAGTVLAGAMPAVRAAADRWLKAPSSKELERELEAKSEALGRTLRDAGLGYHVRIEHGVDEEGVVYVQLTPYHVLSSYAFTVDGSSRHMELIRPWRRLEEAPFLGLALRESALMSSRALDGIVNQKWLPLLADNEPYRELVDVAPALAEPAGEAMRRELRAALGEDAELGAQIGALLVERDRIVEAWPGTRGKIMLEEEIVGLDTPAPILELAPTEEERSRVLDLEQRVEQMGVGRIADRLAQRLAQIVILHEGQHLFDQGKVARKHGAFEARAYLGVIVRDPKLAHVGLWMLAGRALASESYDSEAYAGALVVTGLVAALGDHIDRPLVEDDQLSSLRFIMAAIPLAMLSSEEISQAAAALWKQHYGDPVAPIVPLGRVDRVN